MIFLINHLDVGTLPNRLSSHPSFDSFLSYFSSLSIFIALVALGSTVPTASTFLGGVSRFVDDSHHLLLKILSLQLQTVLVPDIIRSSQLKVMTLHAPLKKRENVTIVGVCSKR